MKAPQEKRAEREKIEDCRQSQRGEDIEPKLAAAGRQREQQQRDGKRQAEEQIEDHGRFRPQTARGAQQIIERAERQRERAGAGKLDGLRGNGQLHQPNSRAKKPPPVRMSSS